MALTVVDGGLLSSTNAQYTGFKNRIINGAMVIDQRNAGASVTISTNSYVTDRFRVYKTNASATVTSQRSTTAPAGFANSLLYSVTTGAATGAGDYSQIYQAIEGFNVADLAWGTASAATVTLSFWVRSSVTGTYGVCLNNSAANRCYVASYVVNSANTFEYKTITIAGDTSGTWTTDNTAGITIDWDMGVGTTYSGSATGAWQSANYQGLTGGVKLTTTSGATFYITGVQLEKGSTATSFDYRPYGTELALCQRYLPAFSGTNRICTGFAATTSSGLGFFQFPVPTRVAPTGVTVNSAGYFYASDAVTYDLQCSSVTINEASTLMARLYFNTTSASQVANRPQSYWSNNAAAILYMTGCEL
jgi:hypothetical protein